MASSGNSGKEKAGFLMFFFLAWKTGDEQHHWTAMQISSLATLVALALSRLPV